MSARHSLFILLLLLHLALLLAFGNAGNDRRVLYLTAEKFMYGFVAALKSQTALAFKEALRGIDVLVIDDLQFLHPIKVGDLIILKARVTCAFTTSLEVRVDVFSEETLTGKRQLTSRAHLTFVALGEQGERVQVPPLQLETEEARNEAAAAHLRRAARLQRKAEAVGAS